MDSLDARLKFIQVLKTLYKTLNLSSSSSSQDTTRSQTVAADTSSPGELTTSATNTNNVSIDAVGTITPSNQTNPEEPIQFYLANYLHHYEDFQQCIIDTLQKLDPLDRLYIYMYYIRILETLYPIVASVKETGTERERERDTLETSNVSPTSPRTSDSSNTASTTRMIVEEMLLPDLKRVVKLLVLKSEVKSLVNLPFCMEKFRFLRFLYIGDSERRKQASERVTAEFDAVEEYLKEMEQFRDELFRYYRDNLVLTKDRSKAETTVTKSNDSSAVQVVLNRMEMDRERHKRQKEQKWIVDRSGDTGIFDEREFDSLWNGLGPFNAIDAESARQLQRVAMESYNYPTVSTLER